MGRVPAGLTNVAEISGGYEHVLALRYDGTVIAWGANSALTNVPTGLSNVVAVAAGAGHSLALINDGTVAAWGYNQSGQSTVPVGLSNVVALAAGYDNSLALRSDGTIIGWGAGLLGGVRNPILGLSNVVMIAADTSSFVDKPGTNLVLQRDGSVTAWRSQGTNITIMTNLPGTWTNLTTVATGKYHLLGLKQDGTVLEYDNNASGQTNVPAGLSNVVAIAGGGAFSLALRSDGTVVGWGDNTYDQTNIPAGLTNVVSISASVWQSLALLGTGPPVQRVALGSPRWDAGVFSVSLASQNGRVYALEYKDSLADTSWQGLRLVAGTGGILALKDPTATLNQRFYRVRRW